MKRRYRHVYRDVSRTASDACDRQSSGFGPRNGAPREWSFRSLTRTYPAPKRRVLFAAAARTGRCIVRNQGEKCI